MLIQTVSDVGFHILKSMRVVERDINRLMADALCNVRRRITRCNQVCDMRMSKAMDRNGIQPSQFCATLQLPSEEYTC